MSLKIDYRAKLKGLFHNIGPLSFQSEYQNQKLFKLGAIGMSFSTAGNEESLYISTKNKSPLFANRDSDFSMENKLQNF